MNPNYTEFKFPQIKAHPWHKVSQINLITFRVLYSIHHSENTNISSNLSCLVHHTDKFVEEPVKAVFLKASIY